ncbi:uncharacterized protein [Aegilops tauschii subsp. strangulata]|uniref:uncharacterized protein isoform X1 n=1 Tax=Aegilops tauschii subsp. strangulata TaxID=200361 RepID=UPI003CC83C0A
MSNTSCNHTWYQIFRFSSASAAAARRRAAAASAPPRANRRRHLPAAAAAARAISALAAAPTAAGRRSPYPPARVAPRTGVLWRVLMTNSEYEYVKREFEFDRHLPASNWIIVRFDGCHFHRPQQDPVQDMLLDASEVPKGRKRSLRYAEVFFHHLRQRTRTSCSFSHLK